MDESKHSRRASRGLHGHVPPARYAGWVLGALFMGACTEPSEPPIEAPLAARGASGLATLTAATGSAREQGVGTVSSPLTRAQAVKSCTNACKIEASCGYVIEPLCNGLCELSQPVLEEHDCDKQAAAENDCLSSMSCGELRRYGDDGRRMNDKCGDVARAFFDDCTLGKGTVAKACTDLCMHYMECELLDVSIAACEETCVGNATGLDWQKGAECSAAFFDYAACVAVADCADVEQLLDLRLSPQSCAGQLEAFNKQCV